MMLSDLRCLQPRDWRLLAILGTVVIAGIALGIVWLSKTNADILREVARQSAMHWAQYLSEDGHLAEDLVDGDISPEVKAVFDEAVHFGDVFRYKIYDADGMGVAASRPEDVGRPTEGRYFRDVVARGQVYVSAKIAESNEGVADGEAPALPHGGRAKAVASYSEAYVPVMKDGSFLGAIEVYVDMGPHVALHRRGFAVAAGGLIALLLVTTAIAGGIIVPNIAARERTENELREAKRHAEAASQAKSAFLANMSHELRTPLNAIIGFSEIMVQQMFGPMQNQQYLDYSQEIHSSGVHLQGIINNILDISKVEAGKQEVRETEIDLATVIRACLSLIETAATKGAVELTAELPPDLPRLHADERLVKQILINLLSNVVKFAPEGGRVYVRAAHEADGSLAVSVADNGIGMSEADIARALEPFEQLDDSFNRRYEGTGLGLSIAKAFVGLHGATLGIQSAPGEGTTVTVRFPPERLRAARSQTRQSAA